MHGERRVARVRRTSARCSQAVFRLLAGDVEGGEARREAVQIQLQLRPCGAAGLDQARGPGGVFRGGASCGWSGFGVVCAGCGAVADSGVRDASLVVVLERLLKRGPARHGLLGADVVGLLVQASASVWPDMDAYGAASLLEGGRTQPHAQGRFRDRQMHEPLQNCAADADRPWPCGVCIVATLPAREDDVVHGWSSSWHPGRRLLQRWVIHPRPARASRDRRRGAP
mmetsp:Transcript_11811/g.28626  ORF Transcript_11811/g.28626 Transcript_11811/m.28626 type:complete len:227 (-) Transcript_11811:104-784(-)